MIGKKISDESGEASPAFQLPPYLRGARARRGLKRWRRGRRRRGRTPQEGIRRKRREGRWERSLGVKLARRGSCQGGGGGCEGVEEEGEKLGGD